MASISPESYRILLFIYYCGQSNEEIFEFQPLSHFHKWYFLSRNPDVLQKFLEKYDFKGILEKNINPSDFFIRNYHGVTLKDIRDTLSQVIAFDFAKIQKRKRNNVLILTKAGLETIKMNHEVPEIIKDYIEILTTIHFYIDKIPFDDVLEFTNNHIKKYVYSLKTPIRSDQQ